MVEYTAKLVIWLCLVCLLFALACVVLSFIANMPGGVILAPVVMLGTLYAGIKYLRKAKGA